MAKSTHRYIFGETHTMDGAGRVDPLRPQQAIRSDSEARARRQLPKNDLGRHWVLLRTESLQASTETDQISASRRWND